MSPGLKDLFEHGRFLRNAAPREFEEFVKAFDKYTETVLATVINAESERDLLRTQGHTQQCMKIAQLLEEIKNG